MDYKKLAEIIADMTKMQVSEEAVAESYGKLPAEYLQVVEQWMNGAEPDYEYNDISISYIQSKEHCSYQAALFMMKAMILTPEYIPVYKKRGFIRR